tara:strand:+ start:533 stop:1153 length:621 start_codon:yes stop_codon:yes gene_type:complete
MINHKHKFIFVHINKTGGTSIESILKKLSRDWFAVNFNYVLNGRFTPKHHLIKEYRKLADKRHGFKNYFKFTIVRNPWDRLLSNYFFRKKTIHDKLIQNLSFKEWVLNYKTDGYSFEDCLSKHTQLDWITSKNEEVLVDFVGRFENLQEDFDIICDKIGVPQQKLPHKNKTKHKHYTEYYDDETRQIVAEKYTKDIEYFGYEFDDS